MHLFVYIFVFICVRVGHVLMRSQSIVRQIFPVSVQDVKQDIIPHCFAFAKTANFREKYLREVLRETAV